MAFFPQGYVSSTNISTKNCWGWEQTNLGMSWWICWSTNIGISWDFSSNKRAGTSWFLNQQNGDVMVLGFKPTNEDICYMGIINDTHQHSWLCLKMGGWPPNFWQFNSRNYAEPLDFRRPYFHLVGGFNLPLWKMMDFVSWEGLSHILWKNKIHVPNHQSDIYNYIYIYMLPSGNLTYIAIENCHL